MLTRNHRFFSLVFCLLAGLIILPATRADDSPLRQGPELVSPGSIGVGSMVPDFKFTDIRGRSGTLSDYTDEKTVVIAMTGTGCPLCKKYAPTLAALERRYMDQDVAFLFLNPNASEDISRLREEVKAKGFSGPYIRDDGNTITGMLNVKTTTEMFVIDRSRTLIYRGAVNDQYGIGYALEAPRKNFVVDALDAVAAGQTPSVQATTSPGCEILRQIDAAEKSSVAVTYHNRVSRIIQQHCMECHREDGVAPMPLENYAQVKDYAGMIRNVVERQVMPPWFAKDADAAADEDDSSTGTKQLHKMVWLNDRSLAESERSDLIQWAEIGAPEGDPADAPLPRSFVEGWVIGQPDDEFEFPTSIPIPADGTLDYRTVRVETGLKEDRWVQAIEVVPGDRSVVHHVLVFVLPPRKGLFGGGRGQNDGINYWGIYVPGNSTQIYPEGFARRLPKGSRLEFQMHYTTNGTATKDRTKVGVIYADEPPKFEVKTESIVNGGFKLQPYLDDQYVSASITLPADYRVLGYLPHHHLRGVKSKYLLTTPDGKEVLDVLLDIPNYDFNWQLYYQYAKPRVFPKGSRIQYEAWYDNSEDNLANPDPSSSVKWGKQTDDEMHIGYVEYVVPVGAEGETAEAKTPDRRSFMSRLDVNADGFITKEEIKERVPRPDRIMKLFDTLDRNKDGKLEPSEYPRR